ncbi:zinc finger MYM-type protein 1 [Tanacetum coccineum]
MINVAEEIAIEIDIVPIFRQKHVIHRKRQFDENFVDQDTSYFVEESFKVQNFLYIVDQALVSLRTRFEQYKEYERVFGFLVTSGKLNSFDDYTLKSHYSHLEAALKNNEQSDVDAKDIFVELRVLLTIPVTVASAKRSFSRLKLLKSYMRSTMSQERLNGLTLIAIENRVLESVDYEDLVNNFASKNARIMALLELEVSDETAHIVVVMFDEPATSLAKCSAESIIELEDERIFYNIYGKFRNTFDLTLHIQVSDVQVSLPPPIANLFGYYYILES